MAERSRYDQKCKDCQESNFVEDRAAGDLICQVCGLVAESHVIDESSEWRTFADSDKPQADRTRVGGATDDLLSEGGIGATVITASTKEGGNTAARNLSRLQTRNNTDKTLQQAYSQINRISDKLGLTKTITDTAQHYYKLVYEQKGARGRGLAAVAAAVLFCACRQEGLPRTFKEIEAVVPDATKKDIGKAYKTIMACLQAEEGAATAAPKRVAVSDYMRRFCSHLGMNQKESKACIDVADNAVPREGTTRHNSPWDGKSPNSIAAAIIYMVTQLPAATNKPSTTTIALECSIAEVTLQSTYRDLYTEKAVLIPKWFAKAEDLQHLQQPRERY
ncbi:hypothetical protein WJX77_007185 [Trebouxia sp. C0004]